MSSPKVSTGASALRERLRATSMSPPTRSRSGLNGAKNCAVPQAVLVERRDRRRDQSATRSARRAPTRTGRSRDRRTRMPYGAARVRRRPARAGRAARSCAPGRRSARRSVAIRADHLGHPVLLRPGEQRRAGVGAAAGTARSCRRTAASRARTCPGRRAVLLSFMYERPCVAPKLPLLQVQRDVEQHEVEHHRGTVREVASRARTRRA